MRIYECNNNVRVRVRVRVRRQLDAFNGPNSLPSVEEVINNHYNDLSYKPSSILLPNLHEDFNVSHDLSLEKVPCKVTPDQVKQWLGDRKASCGRGTSVRTYVRAHVRTYVCGLQQPTQP